MFELQVVRRIPERPDAFDIGPPILVGDHPAVLVLDPGRFEVHAVPVGDPAGSNEEHLGAHLAPVLADQRDAVGGVLPVGAGVAGAGGTHGGTEFDGPLITDRKSTRLNSSHVAISYA